MGSKTNRKSNPAKARSSTIAVKQAAKKRNQKWSRDRSERVRDALNRDADLLYNVCHSRHTRMVTHDVINHILGLGESIYRAINDSTDRFHCLVGREYGVSRKVATRATNERVTSRLGAFGREIEPFSSDLVHRYITAASKARVDTGAEQDCPTRKVDR